MNFKLLVPLKNVNKITCKSTANHWVWSGTPGIWWTILVDFAIQDFKPFLLTQRAHSHTYSAVFVVVLAAYSNGLTSNTFFFPPSMHPALIGALPFFQNEYDHIYHSLFVAQSFSVQTMQILNIQRKLQESFLWLTVVFFDETLSHPATSLKTNLKPKPTHNMLEVNLTAIQKKAKKPKTKHHQVSADIRGLWLESILCQLKYDARKSRDACQELCSVFTSSPLGQKRYQTDPLYLVPNRILTIQGVQNY